MQNEFMLPKPEITPKRIRQQRIAIAHKNDNVRENKTTLVKDFSKIVVECEYNYVRKFDNQ